MNFNKRLTKGMKSFKSYKDFQILTAFYIFFITFQPSKLITDPTFKETVITKHTFAKHIDKANFFYIFISCTKTF